MKKWITIISSFSILLVLLFVLFKKESTPKENYVTTINFDKEVLINGNGANYKNKTLTITNSGIYTLTGSSNDANIVINANGGNVTLMLQNFSLTSNDTAPIYVKKAKLVTITSIEETENYLSSSSNYTITDNNEINAVIHSKADLILNGNGKLNIETNYNNGINGKDSVEIRDTTISIQSKNNGIKAKDSLKVENANITVKASGNGIKAYNETEKSSGTMELINSTIQIEAEEDGIEAIHSLTIDGGTYEIITGGGSKNASTLDSWGMWGNHEDNEASAKGIKTDGNITIKSGTFKIDSSDDSIHSNDTVTISSGIITLSSGDDGIHADKALTIEDGEITIEKSYEGLEASIINLKGGSVHVTASDDGINAAGGSDSSAINRKGANMFASDGSKIEITGGYYVIHAEGDGIDSNGDIIMEDGTLIIEGPTNNGNGAIDYNGTYNMNGGTLIAVGSSGMAEAPSNSSKQNSMKLSFSAQKENTTIQVLDSENKPLLTFSPSKNYSSLVYSSKSLETNKSYTISLIESSSQNTDGVVSTNSQIMEGTVLTTLTLTDTITTYGNGGMQNGFGGKPNGIMDDFPNGEIPNRGPRR